MLTMEGLAERVGISRQTLYHHFASKEHIALQAVLTLMAQGLQAIQESTPRCRRSNACDGSRV